MYTSGNQIRESSNKIGGLFDRFIRVKCSSRAATVLFGAHLLSTKRSTQGEVVTTPGYSVRRPALDEIGVCPGDVRRGVFLRFMDQLFSLGKIY